MHGFFCVFEKQKGKNKHNTKLKYLNKQNIEIDCQIESLQIESKISIKPNNFEMKLFYFCEFFFTQIKTNEKNTTKKVAWAMIVVTLMI